MHSLTYFSFLPSPTSCFRGSLRTLGSFMAYQCLCFPRSGSFAFQRCGVRQTFPEKKKNHRGAEDVGSIKQSRTARKCSGRIYKKNEGPGGAGSVRIVPCLLLVVQGSSIASSSAHILVRVAKVRVFVLQVLPLPSVHRPPDSVEVFVVHLVVALGLLFLPEGPGLLQPSLEDRSGEIVRTA